MTTASGGLQNLEEAGRACKTNLIQEDHHTVEGRWSNDVSYRKGCFYTSSRGVPDEI